MWQHVTVPTCVECVVISCSVSLQRLDSLWSWQWIAIAVARNSSTTLSPARVDCPYHPLKSERWWMRHNLGLWVASFTEKGTRSNLVSATYSPDSAILMGSATTGFKNQIARLSNYKRDLQQPWTNLWAWMEGWLTRGWGGVFELMKIGWWILCPKRYFPFWGRSLQTSTDLSWRILFCKLKNLFLTHGLSWAGVLIHS